jgi:argininosuccinate lyase
VATDFRLWVREACDALAERLGQFEKSLATLSKAHSNTIMPGFTHLQVAQPVTLGLHLDAYTQMMSRDRSRFADCRKRLNQSPLGAAALAGTPYNIDRAMTAKELGFDAPLSNTMDAVSARDFATEFLFACDARHKPFWRAAQERKRFGLAVEGGTTLYPVAVGERWRGGLGEWLR